MTIREKVRFWLVLMTSVGLLAGCSGSGSSGDSSEIADPAVSAGVKALEAGQWNEAIEQLEQAVNLQSAEVRVYRGSAYAGRAGISAAAILAQFMGEAGDGTKIFVPSTTQAMGLVNYNDSDAFRMRLLDGQKALALLTPEDGSFAALGDEQRLEAGLVACGQFLLRVAEVLSGQNPAQMSFEEIDRAVNDRYDENRQGLEKSVAVILETRDEIAKALTDNFVEAAITSEALGVLFEQTGIADGTFTAGELTSLLQGLNG